MGSTRLPGKSMLPLAGEPLIYRVLQRIIEANSTNEVILAIPDSPLDDVLVHQAKRLGIPWVRGSETNVADRYIKAILQHHLDIVIRIPADNYLTEPWAIALLIEEHLKFRSGFTTNIMPILKSGFPDGVGGEAFQAEEFRLKHSVACKSDIDEHVHKHFYDYRPESNYLLAEGSVRTIQCPLEFAFPSLSFDVNTREQYEFASALYDALWDDRHMFGILDAVTWINSKK
jgi:spore coat polysaccharide biosynthesis protein SpsF